MTKDELIKKWNLESKFIRNDFLCDLNEMVFEEKKLELKEYKEKILSKPATPEDCSRNKDLFEWQPTTQLRWVKNKERQNSGLWTTTTLQQKWLGSSKISGPCRVEWREIEIIDPCADPLPEGIFDKNDHITDIK